MRAVPLVAAVAASVAEGRAAASRAVWLVEARAEELRAAAVEARRAV